MPAVSNVVINDGATTPVATTFSSIGQDAKGVWWYEQTSPAPSVKLGARKMGVRIQRALAATATASDTTKIVFTLMSPTLSVSGNAATGYVAVPRIEYKCDARLELNLPERSATAERTDMRALVRNFLGHALAVDLVDNLSPLY